MDGSGPGGGVNRPGGIAPPRRTFPGELPQLSGGEVETDGDLLPFALDREPSVTSPCRPSFPHEELGMEALSETDPSMSGDCLSNL